MSESEKVQFTVGELAKMVGVTVRTLQYYDRIGLLRPLFTEGGRRIYTRDDILNLQQILFLKSLGFSLDEIKNKILKSGCSDELAEMFTEQRGILSEQIKVLSRIIDTLDQAVEEIKSGQQISLERLTTILHLMKEGTAYAFVLRYFSEEQYRNLEKHFESPEKYRNFTEKSEALFHRLILLHRRGENPAGPEGQKFAAEWWNMVGEFAGGDRGMLETLISVGHDMERWPPETSEIQKPIKDFLSEALNLYLKKNPPADLPHDPEKS